MNDNPTAVRPVDDEPMCAPVAVSGAPVAEPDFLTRAPLPDAAVAEASGTPACAPTVPAVSLGPAARGVALPIIATIAVVFALDWAQGFFISLLLGVLFAYTLNPLVMMLERCRIPRVAGTGVVMIGVVCALGLGGYALRGQMQTILDQVPAAASSLSAGLAGLRKGQSSTMQKVQAAANEIERATSEAAGMPSTPRQTATRVVIEPPGFRLGSFLWVGSMGAAELIGQAGMVLFLTFFLLLSGDTYKRKLVRISWAGSPA
jgi:predicted PurR-regulated permease PerM